MSLRSKSSKSGPDQKASIAMSSVGAILFGVMLVWVGIVVWRSLQHPWYRTPLLVGLAFGGFVAAALLQGMRLDSVIASIASNIRRSGNFVTFVCVLAASLVWWRYLGRNNITSLPRIIAISLAGFVVGALLGFLFSSYGEDEAKSIGKVRDWLLAGITGVTLVNAAKLKTAIDSLAGANEETKSIIYCMLIVYAGLGFLLMFFQRELILNVIVAQARVERVQIESTQQTAAVLQRTMAVLPPSLLSGIEDADEITDDSKKDEAKHIRELLYSSDVNSFLDQVDRDTQSGAIMLPWDLISKVAYVHYYRSYFEPAATKATQVRRAVEWITCALRVNPMHADFTMKLADMYGMSGDYSSAIAILEQVITRPECPSLAHQWLGYFLLFVRGREEDSVQRSERYLTLFPSDASTHLNEARAYAQMFTSDCQRGVEPAQHKEFCIAELSKALQLDPNLYSYIKNNLPTQKNYSFAFLENDSKYGKDFKNTLEAFAPRPALAAAAAAGGSVGTKVTTAPQTEAGTGTGITQSSPASGTTPPAS